MWEHTYPDISDLDELSRMIYNTRALRDSVQKSGFATILYPFYRERQKIQKEKKEKIRENNFFYQDEVFIEVVGK